MKFEAIKITLRTWKLLFKRTPIYMVALTLGTLFTSLLPYVTIYFSARLLNAIVIFDEDLIKRELVLFIALEALFRLLSFIFKRIQDFYDETMYHHDMKLYADKMLSLDYEDVDDQKVHALYSDVMENQRLGGYGIITAYINFENLLKASFDVLIGLFLSISLYLVFNMQLRQHYHSNYLFIFVQFFQSSAVIITNRLFY